MPPAKGGVRGTPPKAARYRFGGKQLGYTGNNGTIDTDYQDSIANRTRAPVSNPGAFRWGSTSALAHAAFDPSLDMINSYGQGSSAGGYTVRVTPVARLPSRGGRSSS